MKEVGLLMLDGKQQNERQPRESKLLPEFHQCIDYLNQFLPEDKRMKYIAWDIAAANKQFSCILFSSLLFLPTADDASVF